MVEIVVAVVEAVVVPEAAGLALEASPHLQARKLHSIEPTPIMSPSHLVDYVVSLARWSICTFVSQRPKNTVVRDRIILDKEVLDGYTRRLQQKMR